MAWKDIATAAGTNTKIEENHQLIAQRVVHQHLISNAATEAAFRAGFKAGFERFTGERTTYAGSDPVLLWRAIAASVKLQAAQNAAFKAAYPEPAD